MEDKVAIEIPKDLYGKIMERVKETDFESVDEYATFVLQEVIRELSGEEPEEVFSEDDEEKVKERLLALGYL